MAYFYRRSSGRFYARIRIPEALQPHFKTKELRRSLHTTDRALACRLALAAALEWKAEFARLSGDMDLVKLQAGSPLLLSAGYLSLADAEEHTGLSVRELFDEFQIRQISLYVSINDRLGANVESLAYEAGGPGVDLSEMLMNAQMNPFMGMLRVRQEVLRITDGRDGVFRDCAFHRVGQPGYVVFDLPELEVPIGQLYVARFDCERVRSSLASKVTPAMLAAAQPAPPSQDGSEVLEQIRKEAMGSAYKYLNMPVSELLEVMYREKGKKWKASTMHKNRQMHGLFVELMGDPVLGMLDRELIKTYQARLLQTPKNLQRYRDGRHDLKSISDVLINAAKDGVELVAASRADAYVESIAQVFAWATRCGYMRANPVDGVEQLALPTERVRAQDRRKAFDQAMLQKIFTTSWWRDGKGRMTRAGRYYHFQPFNYWMPLIALYSGARLNEIAQLYLKDIACTDRGCWYLDFNLEGEGKQSLDSGDAGSDKQLKTINAERVIALHPELVRLGLPRYAQALREAGHKRLFPELPYDPVKGYGKYAGQWFNERFMGKMLGVTRDGALTFHSFRHTFLTACSRTDMPDHLRNQIAGHSRGEGVAYSTYIKDRSADEQIDAISKVSFELPRIECFDLVEGLRALNDAMSRKARRGAVA